MALISWLLSRKRSAWMIRLVCAGRRGSILVFTGQTSLVERDRIKIAFNAPFEKEAVRILVCTDAARETPVRGLIFQPPHVREGEPEPQDVVQLHLEHRLVKRLISRFASQGFRSSVGRITAIVGPGSQPRVVLVGRLSLFGPGARRLHEEIIPITAAWRDTRRGESPLTPFAESGQTATVAQLDEALRKGISPVTGVIERLRSSVEPDSHAAP